ncbi:hypothetical protein QVD17_18818 [Tagetes erecta]|uniref:Uncharacterized protein n=1 Tax=Tagetes erecta TaxID=13708 RepID=A0AAD8KIE3_TARER|nr:hypothetical protein QVD17_18818 [Tagetes erecta]
MSAKKFFTGFAFYGFHNRNNSKLSDNIYTIFILINKLLLSDHFHLTSQNPNSFLLTAAPRSEIVICKL